MLRVRSIPTTSALVRLAIWRATPAVPDATSRTRLGDAGTMWSIIALRHLAFCPNDSHSASRSYRAGRSANRRCAKRLRSPSTSTLIHPPSAHVRTVREKEIAGTTKVALAPSQLVPNQRLIWAFVQGPWRGAVRLERTFPREADFPEGARTLPEEDRGSSVGAKTSPSDSVTANTWSSAPVDAVADGA